MRKPVQVFYDGGLGSTFRLIELVQDGETVQPIYIPVETDPVRASAIDRRMQATCKLVGKEIAPNRILTPIIINVSDLKVGQDIRKALAFLGIPFGGEQWLLMAFIAFSLTVGEKYGSIEYCQMLQPMRPWSFLDRVRDHLDAYGYVQSVYADLGALQYLRFPLKEHTRLTLQVVSRAGGWNHILNLTNDQVEEVLNERWCCN